MEIERYLGIRMRVEVDRRLALGFTMAKAMNSPKMLSEDLEKWERTKRPARAKEDDYVSDGSDLIALFQTSGLEVIDETKH